MTIQTGLAPAVSRRAALTTVLAVLFLTFLDTTIVSVTLGNLESDISAGIIPLQWVINGYALVFASLMLIGGSLSDRFGRKWVMLGGVVIFCVGSLMCAVASGVAMVIAGRAVMGVGAAASEPGTLSVIRQLYPDSRERARALGAWSAVSGLALALGPVIGGLLVGAGDWRSVFWFNLALGIVLVIAVWAFVPDSRDPQPGRIDLAGFVLGTGGIFCLVFAAISGEYKGYGTWWIIALFVIGGLGLIAFGPVESRVRTPMLNPRYIRAPIVRSALFSAFAVYFGVFAIFFLTALYLDVGLHYSGWKIAGMFAPMAAAIVVGGLAAGPWVARVGSRPPMVIGCGLAAAGMLLARVEVGEGKSLTFGLLALALALAGLGFGVTVVPLTSAVLSHIPARHSGIAASATNTARQLGAVVGVAVLGAIVNAHLTDAINEQFSSPLLSGARQSILKILETGGSSGSFSIDDIPDSYVTAFLHGLEVSLVLATVLIVLAGLASALVREPPPVDEAEFAEQVGARTS
jgi:EmrB/QacA subfamily drug resistance transporter